MTDAQDLRPVTCSLSSWTVVTFWDQRPGWHTQPVDPSYPYSRQPAQGSLHYTPEHCLVNGGFRLFWWQKPCFKWLQNVSFKEPCSNYPFCLFQGWQALGPLVTYYISVNGSTGSNFGYSFAPVHSIAGIGGLLEKIDWFPWQTLGKPPTPRLSSWGRSGRSGRRNSSLLRKSSPPPAAARSRQSLTVGTGPPVPFLGHVAVEAMLLEPQMTQFNPHVKNGLVGSSIETGKLINC